MCSCTPKISCTTRIVGRPVLPAGIARYAGISPPETGIFTSPALSPDASVVIVCASSGPAGATAAAKPLASEPTTNPRRPSGAPDTRLRVSASSASSCSARVCIVLLLRVAGRARPGFGTVPSVRLFPVAADAALDLERHRQARDAGHQCRQSRAHLVELGLGHLENQFVVDLHDELRLPALVVEPALHGDHRHLDQV